MGFALEHNRKAYEKLMAEAKKEYNARPDVKAKQKEYYRRREKRLPLVYLSHPRVQSVLGRMRNPFDRIDFVNRLFKDEIREGEA